MVRHQKPVLETNTDMSRRGSAISYIVRVIIVCYYIVL